MNNNKDSVFLSGNGAKSPSTTAGSRKHAFAEGAECSTGCFIQVLFSKPELVYDGNLRGIDKTGYRGRESEKDSLDESSNPAITSICSCPAR